VRGRVVNAMQGPGAGSLVGANAPAGLGVRGTWRASRGTRIRRGGSGMHPLTAPGSHRGRLENDDGSQRLPGNRAHNVRAASPISAADLLRNSSNCRPVCGCTPTNTARGMLLQRLPGEAQTPRGPARGSRNPRPSMTHGGRVQLIGRDPLTPEEWGVLTDARSCIRLFNENVRIFETGSG